MQTKENITKEQIALITKIFQAIESGADTKSLEEALIETGIDYDDIIIDNDDGIFITGESSRSFQSNGATLLS